MDAVDVITRKRKRRKLDLDQRLGRLLAEHRRANRVNQEEVARALGCKRPLISKIEHGQRSVNAVELLDYAKAIGMRPDELFDGLQRITLEYDERAHRS